jgi:hypothetical protein
MSAYSETETKSRQSGYGPNCAQLTMSTFSEVLRKADRRLATPFEPSRRTLGALARDWQEPDPPAVPGENTDTAGWVQSGLPARHGLAGRDAKLSHVLEENPSPLGLRCLFTKRVYFV